MSQERGEAGVGNAAHADAVFAGETAHELLGEMGHVLPVFAQRRHVNGHDVEAEEEVLAEFLALDAFLEVAVGGGDDADIHLDGAVAADAFELALLEDAQQLGLDLRRNLADFVQQDGPAVGQFEAAFAFGQRAGERALFVAEEFAFDEVLRDGGAIDA